MNDGRGKNSGLSISMEAWNKLLNKGMLTETSYEVTKAFTKMVSEAIEESSKPRFMRLAQ